MKINDFEPTRYKTQRKSMMLGPNHNATKHKENQCVWAEMQQNKKKRKVESRDRPSSRSDIMAFQVAWWCCVLVRMVGMRACPGVSAMR